MKQFLFILIALQLSMVALSQTKGSAKLYGYVQEVSGGKRPEISESAENSRGPRKNYLIYAASATRIYPTTIWVEGVQYGVTPKTITKTPVKLADENNLGSSKQTLVPATKQKVIQLILNSTPSQKTNSKAISALAKSNEIVFVYKLGDKTYYSLQKRLTMLEAAAMQ